MASLATIVGTNTPVKASSSQGRWEFLDALRGIAALLVVFQHSLERNPAFNHFSSSYLNCGEVGVVAFFLVSGYIIPVSLERYGSAARFWIGRAFRLLPVYWVSLLVISVLRYYTGTLHSMLATAGRTQFFFANLTMTQETLHVPYALAIYWTLSFEAIFYVLCTVFFLTHMLHRTRDLAIAAAGSFLLGNLAVAIFAHHALSAEKIGVLTTAFVGTLIYRHSAGLASKKDILLALAVMAPAVLLANYLRLGLYAHVGPAVPNRPLSGDSSFLLGYVLFGILYTFRSRQFPPILMLLGKISYSIYLWHAIVLYCLPPTLHVWQRVLLTFVLTLGISTLSYSFIEQPALAFQRRLFPHRSPLAKA